MNCASGDSGECYSILFYSFLTKLCVCMYVHVCACMHAGKHVLQGFRFIQFGIIKNRLFPWVGGYSHFASYVGLDPASTVYQKKYQEHQAYPKTLS